MEAQAGYGLWPLVIINTALFALFAVSFFHPRTGRDWRAMGAFTAFLLALFTEMYGIPLTVYLLSGWLGSRFPVLQPTHSSGHLWNDLIGWTADPHLSPFHLASYAFIAAGFWLSPPPGRCCTRPPKPTGSRSPDRTPGCDTRSTTGCCSS